MYMRERLGGELLWTPNLALSRAGGAPSIHQGHMGSGFGSILVGGGGCFLAILGLI
jgi:hypothetical protein